MFRWFLRCALVLLVPATLRAQSAARPLQRFRPRGDTVVAIAFYQPATGRSAWLGADIRLHAASTMKLPVLIELARRIDRGEMSWTGRIPVENSFRSIAEDAQFAVDPADDSDSTLYTLIGQEVPIQELARLMVVRSSNLATNVLIERLTAVRVTTTARALGADSAQILRGVEDGAAFRRGMNNTLTARDLARLCLALLQGRAASPEGTQRVLGLLAGQEFNGGIPAGLPAGTLVAHKTGWITGAAHDAAIVYPASSPPYILVIMTRGYGTEADAEAVMRLIAAEAHRIATRR